MRHNDNSGPWTLAQQQAVLDAISSGYSGSSLVAYVCTATGRSQASVERRLIKIGHWTKHGRSWNCAWGHVR